MKTKEVYIVLTQTQKIMLEQIIEQVSIAGQHAEIISDLKRRLRNAEIAGDDSNG